MGIDLIDGFLSNLQINTQKGKIVFLSITNAHRNITMPSTKYRIVSVRDVKVNKKNTMGTFC